MRYIYVSLTQNDRTSDAFIGTTISMTNALNATIYWSNLYCQTHSFSLTHQLGYSHSLYDKLGITIYIFHIRTSGNV